MNTRLLRMGRRDSRGITRWIVPGFGNGITYNPNATGFGANQWGPSVRWPARDAKGELLKCVDLGRHRTLARNEIRKLLQMIKGEM